MREATMMFDCEEWIACAPNEHIRIRRKRREPAREGRRPPKLGFEPNVTKTGAKENVREGIHIWREYPDRGEANRVWPIT